ncbi:MAG: ABC transporter permease [Coriobacteriales bacterium]|jgi:ABC-2 type transport system permease protein|nr:ABC transporter permease [Coriobacteriales bacterium]
MLSFIFMNTLRSYLKRDLFVLTSLVSKDFKIKYRRSVLGVAWSVLNPLLMMIVMSAVFSFMFRFEIDKYPLYLILGMILFNFMTNSTNGGLMSIIDSAALLKKIRINKAIFPIEKVVFELLNFAISLVAVAAVMIFFEVAPSPNLLFLPLLLVYVVLFCAGLSLLVSALAVFFRDVVHLWSVFCLAWMYVTPIFYPVTMLPEWLQQAMDFNPMYQFITYFRMIALYGETPSLVQNLICLGMAVVTLGVGILVFRRMQSRFILYV